MTRHQGSDRVSPSAAHEPTAPGTTQPNAPTAAAWIQVFIYLLVIWLVNARLAPDINESHYLTKAKHLWNPQFAPGDLFLSSGNAHWLFAQLAGWMSTWLPLAGVAWVGRVMSWIFMAIAWQRCVVQLRFGLLVSSAILLGWMLATRWGNWAGEWAIGGFEAKSLAYPCVMWAIAACLSGRWPRAWLWLGMSIALHPLVGGWAGLTLAAAWLWYGRMESPLRKQWLTGAFGFLLSLIGVAPALAMIGGPSRVGDVVIAQIHAYLRLAHHQAPHLFSRNQHFAGATTLALFVAATALIQLQRKQQLRSATESSSEISQMLEKSWRLIGLAWLAMGISGVGLLIDLVGVPIRPDIAAGLLRFYWFRWSDIIVPLAWVTGMWCAGCVWISTDAPSSNQSSGRARSRGIASRHALGVLALTSCALWTVAAAATQLQTQMQTTIAPADERLLMSDSSQLASGPEIVEEWIAACAWVRDNTPNNALFLTPRAQQTFKWYAERAEVVTYKDVPQDSQSLLTWYERINRCAPPRNAANEPLGYSTAQILRLHKRYKFQYILVDRRIQREPPLLEMVYPHGPGQGIFEGNYAVFKLPQQPTTH